MSKLADRLIAFNKDLLPEMVQLKYEAMTENAFRFYRGTMPFILSGLGCK